MSDQEKFLSERADMSNNSYARASKQLFMHQQRMLKKHEEAMKKAQKTAQDQMAAASRKPHSKKRQDYSQDTGGASVETVQVKINPSFPPMTLGDPHYDNTHLHSGLLTEDGQGLVHQVSND